MLSRITLLGVVGLFVFAGISGCGGSLSPLYSDFRIEKAVPQVADSVTVAQERDSTKAPAKIQDAIAEALREVGWELDEAPSENAVSTKEVEIVDWGLYDVRVSLDVVPINNKFVRVYVHPYRQYFFGARTKMSYLNRRVRSYVFPDLAIALQSRGIVPLGKPPDDPEKRPGEADRQEDESQAAVNPSLR